MCLSRALRGNADGVQSSAMPTVPCAQEMTGQPPLGALPFGMNIAPVLDAIRLCWFRVENWTR